MRGSVQFTDRDTQIKTGLCALALLVILFAALLILVGLPQGLRSGEKTNYRIESLVQVGPNSGGVYFLDVASGTITHIGQFDIQSGGGGSMSIILPAGKLDPQAGGLKTIYWREGYSTYGPYFNFINGVDLRERLNAVLKQAFNDPEVRARFQELLEQAGPVVSERAEPYFLGLKDDPEVRDALVNMGIEYGIRWLEKSIRGGERDEMEPRERTGAQLSGLLGEKAAAWPWGEWFGEVFADPKMQARFSIFINSLEPYMRASLNELLWTPSAADGREIASVRLLWVARRALFGGREPAITLIHSAGAPPWSASGTIQVREAQ